MATSTTTSRKATSPKATPTPTPTTTTAPVGATTTTAVGTPQSQVAALVHLLATLDGVTLANGDAAWPGYGKVVRLGGTAAAVYVNRANLDVRAGQAQVAAWAKAGLGVARGPQGQYLRMPFSGTGTKA
jgi:hypothetical protein